MKVYNDYYEEVLYYVTNNLYAKVVEDGSYDDKDFTFVFDNVVDNTYMLSYDDSIEFLKSEGMTIEEAIDAVKRGYDIDSLDSVVLANCVLKSKLYNDFDSIKNKVSELINSMLNKSNEVSYVNSRTGN